MLFSKKNSVAQMTQQQTNSIDENTFNIIKENQIRLFRNCIGKGQQVNLSSVKFRVKINLGGVAEIDGLPFQETIHTCMWNNFFEVLGKIVNEFCSEYASESYSPHLESVDILEMYHAEMNFNNLHTSDCQIIRYHQQYIVPDALKNNK